jgi:polyketide biosynthesis enoyl-CoA hydratase PksI
MGQVVFLEKIRQGVALIRMQDEENKNTFTEQLISELISCMDEAEADQENKCIILTGFGNYFATGGTKEALISIQEGKNSFLDAGSGDKNVYNLPLNCKIPVISAMQGHAIGGGLAMGLFADIVILGKENIYSASFMKYGFTPGFGSTCIFPERLGNTLGYEMLMTARNYRGAELEKRGVPFQVFPKAQVLDAAVEVAEILAEKPRKSLEILKEHMTKDIRSKLPEIIDKEMKMHDETFHLPEVKENILKLYS